VWLQTDVSFRLTKYADRTAVHRIISISELKVTQRRYRKALHVTKMLQAKEEVEFIFKKNTSWNICIIFTFIISGNKRAAAWR